MSQNGQDRPPSPKDTVEPQVLRRLTELGRLVSLPQTTFKLLNLLVNEDTSSRQFQEVVEQDPALTAKVLSLSNSAYYSRRMPVRTIERAITVIGFKELEALALGLGLSETFDLSQTPPGFDGEALWLHSMAVSWIAKELSLLSRGIVIPSEVMIAGLLHDLGLIILISKFPVHFHQILDLTNAGHSLLEAEKSLGLRHELIGWHLSSNWSLPTVFQQAILRHHFPFSGTQHVEETVIVALADNLAHRAGYNIKIETLNIDLSLALKVLDLRLETFQNFIRNLMEKIDQIGQVWRQIMRLDRNKVTKPDSGLANILGSRGGK
ncbi:MAG: HDOD domain-containing protein [Deltaproteobacteria bacterium]|jgi:HD-like signal output (HDOD) protein|nr:HDOD domain-containing protein [Deltaproteobacteria bacterium]